MTTPQVSYANSVPASTGNNGSTTSVTSSSAGSLANQNVFLQLLVTQLKYQDPTNPTSGTEFVTQLAQFSELSNSTQMLADLDAIKSALAAASSGASQTGRGLQSGTSQSSGA